MITYLLRNALTNEIVGYSMERDVFDNISVDFDVIVEETTERVVEFDKKIYIESEIPQLTPEEQKAKLQKEYTDLIQSMLDKEAQKLGYDNCNSVCTYINSGVDKFDTERRSL